MGSSLSNVTCGANSGTRRTFCSSDCNKDEDDSYEELASSVEYSIREMDPYDIYGISQQSSVSSSEFAPKPIGINSAILADRRAWGPNEKVAVAIDVDIDETFFSSPHQASGENTRQGNDPDDIDDMVYSIEYKIKPRRDKRDRQSLGHGKSYVNI